MNKPTIMQFLGTRAIIYFAIMLIGMCVLFIFTINKAQNDAARQVTYVEGERASRHLVMRADGTPEIEQSRIDELNYCFAAVIDKDGIIVSGDIPRDISFPPEVGHERSSYRTVKINGRSYCVYDRKPKRFDRSRNVVDQNPAPSSGAVSGGAEQDQAAGGGYKEERSPHGWEDPRLADFYVRTVLCKDDFRTIYSRIQAIFYGFVVLVVIIFLFDGIWLYRNAAKPVREVCDEVRKLAADPDYSGRVEKESHFYETEVMKEASNRLMDRNERLISQQDEFNENVSHELKTPVAVIRSEVEMLQDIYGDDMPEDVAEAFGVIRQQSDRINGMIAEIRYMAKMNREDFSLSKDAMELSDIAESVCDDIDEVTLRGRKFEYHWEPSEAEIDVALVMVAVRNLIMNAVKFSPEGSTIDLYTGVFCDAAGAGAAPESDDTAITAIKTSADTNGALAFLKVADHGPGIAKEDISRLFEPYFQVRSERNTDGYGLGLTLTMKIAEKHGGTVLVDSEPGKGSVFTLVLPVK